MQEEHEPQTRNFAKGHVFTLDVVVCNWWDEWQLLVSMLSNLGMAAALSIDVACFSFDFIVTPWELRGERHFCGELGRHPATEAARRWRWPAGRGPTQALWCSRRSPCPWSMTGGVMELTWSNESKRSTTVDHTRSPELYLRHKRMHNAIWTKSRL